MNRELGLILLRHDGFNWVSLDIAKWANKDHKNVMRDIREILKANTDLRSHFELVEYKKAPRNSPIKYLTYLMDLKGKKIMMNKYKPKFELCFKTMLKDMFGDNLYSQVKVLNYKIDFYIDYGNIIIEHDGYNHKYSCEYDDERMNKIVNEIDRLYRKGIWFIDKSPIMKYDGFKSQVQILRVKHGEEIKALRKILLNAESKGNIIKCLLDADH